MARFYVLLAVATGLILSSAAAIVEYRDSEATLPPLTPTSIVNTFQTSDLVKDINAFITIESVLTNTISVNIDVQNPLPIEFTLTEIAVDAGLNGTIFATFTQSFPSPGLAVPALGTANSGTIDNVLLPQGTLALLAISHLGVLDLTNTNASISVQLLTITGLGAVPIALNGLNDTSVPTNYSISQPLK
ncbi:hypothetical protein BJ912DRAFT_227016 [Pholiota molesta]|nr:hypothetical protein BJ912DRAFT_227016 [Pholiota molesta]